MEILPRWPYWSFGWLATGLAKAGIWILALGALGALPVDAQTNAPPTITGNRYLLIVETSHSIQRRAEGVMKAVESLLSSGMNGQLRAGDTLGIWTYNDELLAGKLPLQHWSAVPDAQKGVITRIMGFLQAQKFEKSAHLDKVLPTLNKIVAQSPFINVIIVSEGTQLLHGTPFDDQVNRSYLKWRDEQQRDRMPMLTLLRAKSGKWTDFAVAAAPWPLEMPALPPEFDSPHVVAESPPVKPPPTTPAPTNHEPPHATLPPLILSGKKADPTNSSETTPAPAIAPSNPIPSASPTPDPGAQPKAPSSAPSADSASPVPATVAQSATTQTQQPSGGVVERALNPPAAGDSDQPKPKVDVAIAKGTGAVAPAPNGATTSPAVAKMNAETQALTAREDAPAAPPPAATRKRDQAKDPAKEDANAEMTATAASPSLMTNKLVWLGALSLLAIGFASAWVLLRRPRAASQASMITRSLERERMP